MEHVNDPHGHAPDEFDHLLGDRQATATRATPTSGGTVAVPLSAATHTSLTERAAREGKGKDVADIVADALRASAA